MHEQAQEAMFTFPGSISLNAGSLHGTSNKGRGGYIFMDPSWIPMRTSVVPSAVR